MFLSYFYYTAQGEDYLMLPNNVVSFMKKVGIVTWLICAQLLKAM